MFNINQVQQKFIGQNIQGLKSAYNVQKVIGSGTSGCVCVGMDNNKNIPVAIKIQLYMSNHELNICQQFTQRNMTNLVNIWDVFKLSNVVFIIMEYANGGSLTQYLNKLGQNINLQLIDNIIKQVANGVLELHNDSMIHRDIKMDNIVICTVNNVAYFKLCDYGLARQLQQDQNPQTNNIGTPTHMAPELIGELKPYNNKVDIWALACLWYQLITKRDLFPGRTIQEVFTQIQQATDAKIANSIEMLKLAPVREQLLKLMLNVNYMLRPSIQQVIQQLQPNATMLNLDKEKMLNVCKLNVPVLAVDKKQNVEKRISLQFDLEVKRMKDQLEIKMAKQLKEKLNDCELKYREQRNNGGNVNTLRMSRMMQEAEVKDLSQQLNLQMEQEMKVINQQVEADKQREVMLIKRDLENQYKQQLEQELHQLRQELGQQQQAQFESSSNGDQVVQQLSQEVDSIQQQCENYKQQLEFEKQQNANLQAEIQSNKQLIEQQRLEIIQLNNKLLQQQQQIQQPKHNQVILQPQPQPLPQPQPQPQLQPQPQPQPQPQQQEIKSLMKLQAQPDQQPFNSKGQNIVPNPIGDKQIQLQIIKARPKLKEQLFNQVQVVIREHQGQNLNQMGDRIRQIVMECYNISQKQPILSL